MILQQVGSSRLCLAVAASLFFAPAPFGQRIDSVSAAISESNTVDIVYIGDSITYGALLPDPDSQSAPVVCINLLRNRLPQRNFFMSNQGRSGHTTVDVLPSSNLDFPAIEQAATQLRTEHPGLLVFSIMLGTNDSAESGPRGAPVSAAQYGDNLREIISRLLLDFPGSIMVVQRPSWYSPNTHNNAVYEERGLARLQTYFPVIDSTVRSFSKAPDRVFEGDTSAFEFFEDHYRTDLTPEEGRKGIFYLHPNVQGAQALAGFWSSAIRHVLEVYNQRPGAL